jgi:SnoaL-like polyketide cyclase
MKNYAKLVRDFIDDVLNHGNIEASGEYFHEDLVELAPFPGQGPGLSGLKDVLRGFRAAFPDMHWSVEDTRFIMDALGLMTQMGVFAALGGELKAES